jgi:energy-coupling factor transporter ATP-binding protein EcfA2
MIELSHISYFYPNTSTAALEDITLTIEPGEFVLLVGESGAGKSTLLRLFNGLVPHFSGGRLRGTAVVNGHDVVQSGPQHLSQEVGFVHQSPEAQAVLDSVEPEIAFALENAGLPPDEMRLRVEEVLDLLDLTPLRQRPLVTLSGGERQRVAIAAALALRPSILVLDEPTSQLDPKSAEDVLQALVRLNEDLGLTVVLAEHRLERVLRYVDRIVYVNHGRVAADGQPQEVLDQLPIVPPLVELAQKLNWQPYPLTIKAGRRYARQLTNQVRSLPDREPANQPTNQSAPLLTIETRSSELWRPNRPA